MMAFSTWELKGHPFVGFKQVCPQPLAALPSVFSMNCLSSIPATE